MTTGADWSRGEVEAAVSEYFEMLTMELRGEPFNKAEHNRGLQGLLKRRTKSAIEMKHQNITAVLIELGAPYIAGYKPLSNLQKSLLPEVVEEQLARSPELQRLIETVVTAPFEGAKVHINVLPIRVPAPKAPARSLPPETKGRPKRVLRGVRNYLEIEARNRSLGRAGEEMVMQFEHRRLWKAGWRKLAEQIEHVAVTLGDGLGYDILSFEMNGRKRLIEVKTTQFGRFTPFFATRNEVNISGEQRDVFQLYRLFEFNVRPRLFIVPGALRHTCRLDAVVFSALPQ
ncbi:MAG TPA: DUF3883 domain-containing protein [Chthoniobacterales bacterium]|jgi:hypothetical protein